MGATRHAALDEVGDLGAPPGSRPWSIALRMRMQAALNDERSSANQLRRWMDLLSQHKGYLALANADGEQFATFETFCRAPMPFGLGYDITAINAIIDERKTAEARAATPKLITTHGGDRKSQDQGSNTTLIGDDRGADYLTARIARDHPEVLKQMKDGKFKSVRQAALSVGIVRPRASVYVDDPDKISEFLAKHFDIDDIKRIADLAVHIRDGQ